MSRPRAGHGWTAVFRKGRMICLIADCHGHWVPTYAAKNWPRCRRCRRPEHMMPENSGLCTTCFYYKNGKSADWFWSRKEDYLFPYNIGDRVTRNHILFEIQDEKTNWRRVLKSQVH